MPATIFAMTHRLRTLWSRYWANRPLEEPLDLPTVLDSATVLEQLPDGTQPQEGTELWVHDNLPGWYFAVRVNDFERVVVGFRPFRKAKAARKEVEPIQPELHQHIVFPTEPSGLSTVERRTWWKGQYADAVAAGVKAKGTKWHIVWCNRQMVCQDVLSKLNAELRAVELAKTTEGKAEKAARALLDAEPSDQLTVGPRGNIDFLPVVLWLLREVKELKAKP